MTDTNLSSNITDTALIFEGGGMRASYTAAVANLLIENELYFDHVYGVSAGSSNTVNYLSRDQRRTHDSFTTFSQDPRFGGIGTFLRHQGMFNSHFVYQEAGEPDGVLPFDFDTFHANPAQATIAGFERDTGRTRYWTTGDFDDCQRLMLRVRASSSLPFFMPPPLVDGQRCYDGGLAEGTGLLLERARRDGFEKYFIVRTRPKAYRKTSGRNLFYDLLFWRRPFTREALSTRSARYNTTCDEIDRLAQEGAAYVFYAEDITAKSGTGDLEVLEANYAAGYAQGLRELPAWKTFLNVS